MDQLIGTNFFAVLNPNVNIAFTNEFGYAVFADCIGNPNVVATQVGVYWCGCIMIRNDVLSGNNLYSNQGTIMVPNWVPFGSGGGGSGNALTETITQVAHGFVVGNVVKYISGAYALAQADSVSDAEVLGIVTAVTNADNFTITMYGYVDVLSGLTASTQYFLDPSVPGGLTSVEPTTPGQVVKPVLYAINSTTGYFINYRGELLTIPSSGPITSINGDSTAAQILNVGTAGTDFTILDIGGGIHTFELPTASATNRGALSSADWTTFNGKQNALSFGNLTDTGTDGITVGSGTGAVIGSGTSISQHVADASHNGYLLDTDWSTFNGKLSSTGTGLIDMWGINDINSSIGNNTYTVVLYAEFAGTINELKIISTSGTCTAAVNIAGTPVTGISAVSVSSSIATGTATAANTFAVGNKITLVLSSTSSLVDLQATIKYTRS